jgi:hypothetical protein
MLHYQAALIQECFDPAELQHNQLVDLGQAEHQWSIS